MHLQQEAFVARLDLRIEDLEERVAMLEREVASEESNCVSAFQERILDATKQHLQVLQEIRNYFVETKPPSKDIKSNS